MKPSTQDHAGDVDCPPGWRSPRALIHLGRCIAVAIALPSILTGCSNGRGGTLTRDEAQAIVKQHPGIRASDSVEMIGLSRSEGSAEAIARASMGGAEYNFKFRRYDDGWRWESVETERGEWLSAAKALDQIRERDRQKRLAEWRSANESQYAVTALIMTLLAGALPHRGDVNVEEWTRQRRGLLARFARESNAPAHAIEAMTATIPVDAWGTPIVYQFRAGGTAVFRSNGADGQPDTLDDVKVVAERRSNPITEAEEYHQTWTIPQGIGTIQPSTKTTVEFVQIVKP